MKSSKVAPEPKNEAGPEDAKATTATQERQSRDQTSAIWQAEMLLYVYKFSLWIKGLSVNFFGHNYPINPERNHGFYKGFNPSLGKYISGCLYTLATVDFLYTGYKLCRYLRSSEKTTEASIFFGQKIIQTALSSTAVIMTACAKKSALTLSPWFMVAAAAVSLFHSAGSMTYHYYKAMTTTDNKHKEHWKKAKRHALNFIITTLVIATMVLLLFALAALTGGAGLAVLGALYFKASILSLCITIATGISVLGKVISSIGKFFKEQLNTLAKYIPEPVKKVFAAIDYCIKKFKQVVIGILLIPAIIITGFLYAIYKAISSVVKYYQQRKAASPSDSDTRDTSITNNRHTVFAASKPRNNTAPTSDLIKSSPAILHFAVAPAT